MSPGRIGRDLGWPSALAAMPALLSTAQLLFSRLTHHANWLEAASSEHRAGFMSGTTGASGSLLGFVIATLAILIALPDTNSTRALRRYRGWSVLQWALLATAMNLLVLLAFGIYTGVSDGDVQTAVVIGYSLGGLLSLGFCGLLFGLVLANLIRDASSATPKIEPPSRAPGS